MRLLVIAAVLAALLPSEAAHAQAQPELERLRRALRAVTMQLRAAEDQRAALQAKVTESDREKERLNTQVKDAQDTLQKTTEEFNQRMAERDETLEKWRGAYEEAANVARTKDAERAQHLAEATTFKARSTSCEARNKQLLKVSQDMLAGYRNLTLGDRFAINEPMIGFGRVDHQNRTQDFRDRILDQDAKLPFSEEPGSKEQKPQDKKSAARRDDRKKNDKKEEAGGEKKEESKQPAPGAGEKEQQ